MTHRQTPGVTIPPEDDPRYDLMVALDMLETSQPDRDKARLYYDGRVSEWHADPKVSAMLAKSSVGYPFRLAAVPVDTLAERTRLTAIDVDDSAQETWNRIYERNDMKSWSSYQHFQTFLMGDTYARLSTANTHREVDDQDEPADDNEREVDITYMSPNDTIVVYDNRNPKLPRYAVHRWHVYDLSNHDASLPETVFADVYYPGEVHHWRTLQQGMQGVAAVEWARYTPEGAEGPIEPHELEDELPIKHARTDFVYGNPVHEAAYGPHNAIMKHLVTELATVDTHGWPVRMLLADPAAVLDQANDGPDWDEEDPDEEIPVPKTSEVTAGMREAPGIIHFLEGVKEVATFEATNPDHLIKPVLDVYLPMMAVTTRTPLYEFNPQGESSGKERQVADGPINKKIEKMHGFLNDFWEQVTKGALKLAGASTEKVEVGWVPTQLASDKEGWEVAHLMIQAGVPWAVVMTKMGFDPATVKTWTEPPKPWEMGMINTPGQSSDPGGQQGGPTGKSNPTKLGTNTRAQEGPTS